VLCQAKSNAGSAMRGIRSSSDPAGGSWGLAGIDHRNEDAAGREIDHIDLHSLRRTFATNWIASGADPKSVQELLGHKTLDMTLWIYVKGHAGTKR
jgi:integrase